MLNIETLITTSNFLILVLIVITPILILIVLKRLKTKRTLIIYAFISLFILGALMWIFAWWADKSNMILLNHYGYNIDGMNDTEFYGNVLPENRECVDYLVTSIMGIGWPLKAMFGFVMFIPYLIIVYIGKVIINKLKNKKNEA